MRGSSSLRSLIPYQSPQYFLSIIQTLSAIRFAHCSSFALSVVREGFEGTQAAVGVGGGTETGENLIGTNVNFGLVGALIGLLAVGTIFAGFNVWKTFSKKGANDEDGRSLIHSSSKSAVLI